jgi:hypothetical protein
MERELAPSVTGRGFFLNTTMNTLNSIGTALVVWAVFSTPLAYADITLSADLAKQVAAAQGLLTDGKNAEALTKLDEIQNPDALAAPERVLIEKLMTAAAIGAKRSDRVIQSTRYLTQSSNLSAEEKWKFMEVLISAYQSTKNNQELISTAKAYYNSGGKNPTFRLPLAQALAIEGQYQSALDELAIKKKSDLETGTTPPEAQMRVAIYANSKLKNDAGLIVTLKEVLALYPKPDYWSDMVGALFRTRNLTKRQEMDIYRLMEQVGQLADDEDFLGMMDTALKVGLPKDALRLITQMEKGKSLSADVKAKLTILKQRSQSAAADDEKFKHTQPRSGNELAQMADLYASDAGFAEAANFYENALKAGDLKYDQETRLHYAIALFKTGRVPQAKQILSTIAGPTPTAQVSELWGLVIR